MSWSTKRNGADLTVRQMSIAIMIGQGVENDAAADRLGIGRMTLKVYMSRLYDSLGEHQPRKVAQKCERIVGCISS